MIWQTVGDVTQAAKHALAAYRWAWADGEPYVYRYELTKATELLREMNVPVPRLRRYDPRKDEPLPWETTVQAAIARIHAQIEAEKERS
jgi:hypothetical protein